MSLNQKLTGSVIATMLAATSTFAADYELSIQTHFSAESLKGKNVQSMMDDVERMLSLIHI